MRVLRLFILAAACLASGHLRAQGTIKNAGGQSTGLRWSAPIQVNVAVVSKPGIFDDV